MNQLVFIEKGQAVTDSLTVAEVFGKNHKNVLRDIKSQWLKLEEAGELVFIQLNIEPVEYKDEKNRIQPKINLTEDAFTLIAMSYTTPEAMKFKVKFIQEFKRIKEQLQRQFAVPTTFAEALRLAADLQEENERNKPKVEAHDKFISGENYQKVGQVAKVLGIGRNKLFAFLRENKIFMGDNTPYQQFIDRGYFVVKEKPIEMGSQVINKPQTYVTAKGVDYIHKLLDKKIA
ncbi:Rha family transcriptional regulator [Cytobacillus praedii]|uniref:Rha family transcriptional regulator n=1 Tax=Cytobacillus praedii TaxID=1742358 RepID=UPI00070A5942|nr:Rha family transcriptional regulator [Cytobacillus praedii]